MINQIRNGKIINYVNRVNKFNPFFTSNVPERREIGLQIADFQERNQKYKESQKKAESIKNVIWLG
jgi:hypothetical protein